MKKWLIALIVVLSILVLAYFVMMFARNLASDDVSDPGVVGSEEEGVPSDPDQLGDDGMAAPVTGGAITGGAITVGEGNGILTKFWNWVRGD